MAFESLTERLQNVFKNLRKKGKISEADVQEATKEIRLALLEADVALPVVKAVSYTHLLKTFFLNSDSKGKMEIF